MLFGEIFVGSRYGLPGHEVLAAEETVSDDNSSTTHWLNAQWDVKSEQGTVSWASGCRASPHPFSSHGSLGQAWLLFVSRSGSEPTEEEGFPEEPIPHPGWELWTLGQFFPSPWLPGAFMLSL